MRLITAVPSLAPLLSICLLGLTHLPQASAECCTGSPGPFDQRLCGDCTYGTPYCAYGSCNVFGCNCDGGCRHGACDPRTRDLDVANSPDNSEEEIPAVINDAAGTLRAEVCNDDMEPMECVEKMSEALKTAQIW